MAKGSFRKNTSLGASKQSNVGRRIEETGVEPIKEEESILARGNTLRKEKPAVGVLTS